MKKNSTVYGQGVVIMMLREQSYDKSDHYWFLFLFLYLVIDLGHPHVYFPIAFLKIGMVSSIILTLYLITSRRIIESIYSQSKLILFFVGLLFIYVFIAVNNYYAYMTFRNMFLMLPFLLSCIVLINSRSRLLAVCKAYAALMIISSLYGLSHNGVGPGGMLVDENDLCVFLVTYFPLVLFVAGQEKVLFKKFLWMLGIIVTTAAVVFTNSRGGFVGFCAMGAVYWWFSNKKMALTVGIIVLAVLVVMVGGDSYLKDVSTITDMKESTAMTRLLSWEAGWHMFMDNPLGVGGNNFPILFPEYQSESMTRNMWGRTAHSLWFTLIPETGIFGILIYFLIIRMNLKDLKFLSLNGEDGFFTPLVISFYSSFAGFFASATFLSVLYYPYFWHMTIMVMFARNTFMQDETCRLDGD